MTNATKTTAIETTVDLSNINNPSVTLAFSNGKSIKIHASDLTVELAQTAMMHGLKQKLGDAAAIARNPDTGRSATIDDKYNAVREVYDRLIAGQWNKVREGGAPTGGLLLRALCVMYPDRAVDALKAFIAKKTDTEKAALRATARVATIIAELKANDAKNAPPVDEEALFAGLDDAE